MSMPAEAPWFPIRTRRLRLREFRAEDLADVHAYASDPQTVRFMDWGPNTPQVSRERLDLLLSAQAVWPRPEVNLAVELVDQERVIGSIRLSLDGAGGADFGYAYGSPYWRHGYGHEAALALLSAGFDVVRLHRIWATCDTRNAGSLALLEKLGLRREGTFRKDRRVRDGWRNTHLYALLDEEWFQRQRTPG